MSSPKAFIDDLEGVGISVTSVWDLVNSRRPYKQAVPILLQWLERVDDDAPLRDRLKFREGIVRALSVREARGAAGPAMVREFLREPEPAAASYRWTVGNALDVVATEDELEDLVTIASDSSYGRDRQMVVVALGRMEDPSVVPVLRALLADDDVAGHAAIALGRLQPPQARADLERLLSHPKSWVRREAKKALSKLGNGPNERSEV